MKKGTTPSLVFSVDVDLRQAQCYITFAQRNKVVIEKSTVKSELEVDENTIICPLTQDDTLALNLGTVEIQLSYIFADGKVDKSDIVTATVERVLKEGKLEWNLV